MKWVPLIVNVHGGPTGQFNDTYTPVTNLLAAQGWAVLNTNPRGSTGRGVAFEAANKDDMGNGDYLDIMAGIDEVLRTQPLDGSKMALIGYSYGGEMAGFVEGKTNRFKAIVSGAPVIDQFSEYGTESDSFGDRWFTGQPWRHFESAWRQSPLAYAEHAKTPFLLLQGRPTPPIPKANPLKCTGPYVKKECRSRCSSSPARITARWAATLPARPVQNRGTASSPAITCSASLPTPSPERSNQTSHEPPAQ